jgi:signal transduction histidine kinase
MTRLDRQTLAGSWRRWCSLDAPDVGPRWLHWVWTGLFSAAVALMFTLLFRLLLSQHPSWDAWQGWLGWYGRSLVFSLVIGYTIYGLFRLVEHRVGVERIRALRGWQRSVFYTSVPMVGIAIAWPAAYWLVVGRWDWLLGIGASGLLGGVAGALAISLAFHVVFALRARRIAEQMHATEARLKLLQAQVEPHFLFNTLANLHSLMDSDVPRAKAMLESLIDYLRGALGQMRAERSSVGAELDLARAYLEVMAARMGDRLRYSIAADADVRELSVLPMLLQPLVENAIRHGLEPKREGGELHVEARRAGARLTLTVRDDGPGPDAPRRPGSAARAGAGVALDNLRARLAARYGDAASFALERAQHPAGALARIEMPA